MTDEVKRLTLHELIKKHHHNGGAKSKYEFSYLWITDIGLQEEGDLSGIIIKDSTFSGVDFAKVTLTNAKLSNVHFEGVRNLTITICKPKNPTNGASAVSQSGSGATGASGTAGASDNAGESGTTSVAQTALDLSTVLQDISNLKPSQIRELILKSRIKEAVDEVRKRPEQTRFRRDVLNGYNDQCALTGPARDDILEAAHILPYCLLEKVGAKQFGNSRWNGLALRPGLHKLFDENKLRISENGGIFVDSQVRGFYVNWEQIVLPPFSSDDPETRAEHEQVWRSFLRWRWEEYGKYC